MIGLVLLLLLPTPTIWFSLDHKQNVSGIGTLFSLDHKLYASDYDSDSDSVASENQPLSMRNISFHFKVKQDCLKATAYDKLIRVHIEGKKFSLN